jgi:predicted Rossmann fold flavoprotein
MCAIEAGKRGRRVLVLDHAAAPGEKIRISGGGRCNFTNLHCGPGNFLSQNPHFCKSALARYTPHDFIALVNRHGIAWHEKTLGQLFCDGRSQQIIDMLLAEAAQANVVIRLQEKIESVGAGYRVVTDKGAYESAAIVVATGGPSIPKMGATGFAYDLARQFGLGVVPPRAALAPLTFTDEILTLAKDLAGVAVDPVLVTHPGSGARFREALLFTHRGLSGPAILQVSTYWSPGGEIVLDLLPDTDVAGALKAARQANPRQMTQTALAAAGLPARLADKIAARAGIGEARLADCSDEKLQAVAAAVKNWCVKPNGSEGYRTAEVTLGGVDTDDLSSKTFEAKKVPGLYFIGEAVDVTGHLGGHNFQWAWSSGWCCGQAV